MAKKKKESVRHHHPKRKDNLKHSKKRSRKNRFQVSASKNRKKH